MGRWETTSTLEAEVPPAAVWERAYADAEAWSRWNAEIKRASLDGPLALGAEAKIVFRTGLRLRFRVVEFERGRLFTDESRLPGARMGHRHLVEPIESGSRLTNTIYIEGRSRRPRRGRARGRPREPELGSGSRRAPSWLASPLGSTGPTIADLRVP